MSKVIWSSPKGRWRCVSDGRQVSWEVRIGNDATGKPIWVARAEVPAVVRDAFAANVARRFVLPKLAEVERMVG